MKTSPRIPTLTAAQRSQIFEEEYDQLEADDSEELCPRCGKDWNDPREPHAPECIEAK